MRPLIVFASFFEVLHEVGVRLFAKSPLSMAFSAFHSYARMRKLPAPHLAVMVPTSAEDYQAVYDALEKSVESLGLTTVTEKVNAWAPEALEAYRETLSEVLGYAGPDTLPLVAVKLRILVDEAVNQAVLPVVLLSDLMKLAEELNLADVHVLDSLDLEDFPMPPDTALEAASTVDQMSSHVKATFPELWPNALLT